VPQQDEIDNPKVVGTMVQMAPSKNANRKQKLPVYGWTDCL
jgi:hypothetical protein